MHVLLEKDKFAKAFTKCVAGTPITVFLTNGVKLSGQLYVEDEVSYSLTRDGVTQLIMKQAVATVMPQDALSVHDICDAACVGEVG